jgi:sensor c-di-GMP phosphodiesterase-like protein
MKRILKQRIGTIVAFVLLGVACGWLAGVLIGRAFALHAAQILLEAFVEHRAAEEALASAEARNILASLSRPSASYCSDADIVNLGLQVYKSVFLKDVGRIRDGSIICSSIFGRFQHPIPLPISGFSKPGGIRVYWDLSPFKTGSSSVATLQQGDAYVVMGPHAQEQSSPLVDRYITTSIDQAGHSFVWRNGAWNPVSDRALTTNGQGSRNGNLYATYCSPYYSYCLSAYQSVSATLRAQRMQLASGSISGGLLGACFGFMASLLYHRSRSTEQQLRRAIRRDNLHLLYQPIVNLATGRIVGAEALIRWSDEEGFVVSPEIFISLAEENGFVRSITRLVVRHAMRDFSPLLRQFPYLRLSINAAASDLCDPRFLPMLDQALLNSGVSSRSLAIEITERSAASTPLAIETIRALRERGYSVHIDDFGTGYSSLSYLHELSIDAIKIDRAFTQAIGTGAVTTSILPQILSMAETLQLEVIVEGIETKQQADYFSAASPPVLVQGWFFGRPVAPDEFMRLLTAEQNQ